MYGKVEICGVNTSKLKVLSEKEKSILFEKMRDGDKNAREQLINGNLRLVLSIIQSFRNRGENPDDLFQVGCIGLIKAVDHFDPTLKLQFTTYAYPMIVGEIRRYLRDNSSIRVPRSMRDLAFRALKCRETLTSELNMEPTVEEIAKCIGEDPRAVARAMDAVSEPISLYEPVYSDNGDSVYVLDQIKDSSDSDEAWLERIAIKNAVSSLAERERMILLLRFYRGKTQTEVSEEIGISQAQVSRLEKSALDKVKKMLS
ncbi:MAG: RNA polymerase sporulation sigma factor SigG [Clostridia bacterium]|nr:RNA polymerase sporulation sigma factor SigG [Clostridia bacterium]